MKIFAKGTIKVGGVTIAAFLLTLAAPKAVHALVSTLVTVANMTANPVPTQQALPGKPFPAAPSPVRTTRETGRSI